MSLRLAPLALLIPLAVAACGTPREQCIYRNTIELRRVSDLLAEVEGNLARGYAWEEYEIERTRWEHCDRIVKGKDGQALVVPEMCLEEYTDTIRRRVAIDPAAEQRKAAGLRAKKAELSKSAGPKIEACKAAHPE